MRELPEYLKKVLEELKLHHKHYLVARLLGNTYYISEATSRWDKERKKVVNIRMYLGRVRQDGVFREVKHWGTTQQDPFVERTPEIALKQSDILILKGLSMNSRITLANLSMITGLPQSTLHSRIKQLETLYKIRYTLDIDVEKLGYTRYMAFVKFQHKRPDMEAIKTALENIPEIQLVLLTKGAYDLMISVIAENNIEASELIYRVRKETQLGRYPSLWYLSPIEETYGFVPLREEFLKLLDKRVIPKARWHSRDYKKEITNASLTVLKYLLLDSKRGFSDIDNTGSLRQGAADYEYYKLKEDGIIKNATISLKPYLRYNIVILMNVYDIIKFHKTQKELLLNIIENKNKILNKYALVEDINVPEGVLFIAPILYEGESESLENEIREKIKGITIDTMVITEVIIGNLAFRKFDNTYTVQFNSLVRRFGHNDVEKIDYENMTQIKKKPKLGLRGEQLEPNI